MGTQQSITTIQPLNESEYVQVTLGNPGFSYIVDNKWYLEAGYDKPINKWPLSLNLLSSQFSFKPNVNKSNITITMNIEKISDELDIFYVFSVNDQYISFAHAFDNELDIPFGSGIGGTFIYPSCGSLLEIGNASLLFPNITKINNRNNIRNALANGNTSNWYLLTNEQNGNDSTVTFTFINNDIDNTLKFKFLSSTLDLECKSNSSFDVNQDFNIYITHHMGGNYENVYIITETS